MDGGTEWLVDAHGCAPGKLRDRRAVIGVLDAIVDAMELRVIGYTEHQFEGEGGITALYLLAESHLAIHTFPEAGIATLNVYCCHPRKAAVWADMLRGLDPRDITVTEHARGRP